VSRILKSWKAHERSLPQGLMSPLGDILSMSPLGDKSAPVTRDVKVAGDILCEGCFARKVCYATSLPLEVAMSFEPWLQQPEHDEKPAYDPSDPRLLVNILKPEPGKKPPVDWFLDHLVPEEPDEV